MLALVIFGSNGFTAWRLTRPEPDFLPEFHMLASAPGQRLLAELAGTYETGSASGDRCLDLRRDGTVRLSTFGDERAIDEESELTAVPVQTGGRPALLTSERELIEIVDPLHLTYDGDTYRRKLR